MDSVGPDRRCYIGSVVDNGQRLSTSRSLSEGPCVSDKVAIIQLLVTKLDHPHARFDQLTDESIELGR